MSFVPSETGIEHMLGPVFPLLLEIMPTKNKAGCSFFPSDKKCWREITYCQSSTKKLSIVSATQLSTKYKKESLFSFSIYRRHKIPAVVNVVKRVY